MDDFSDERENVELQPDKSCTTVAGRAAEK